MKGLYIHDITSINTSIQVVTLGDSLDAYRNVEAYICLLRKLGHNSAWYQTKKIFRVGDAITIKLKGDVVSGKVSKIEESTIFVNIGYQTDNKAVVERMVDIADLNDAEISR